MEDLSYLNSLRTIQWIPEAERNITHYILYGFLHDHRNSLVWELRICDTIAKTYYRPLDIKEIDDTEIIEYIKDTYQYLKLRYGT